MSSKNSESILNLLQMRVPHPKVHHCDVAYREFSVSLNHSEIWILDHLHRRWHFGS